MTLHMIITYKFNYRNVANQIKASQGYIILLYKHFQVLEEQVQYAHVSLHNLTESENYPSPF